MYPGLYFEGQVDMRGLRNDFPSTSIRTRTLSPTATCPPHKHSLPTATPNNMYHSPAPPPEQNPRHSRPCAPTHTAERRQHRAHRHEWHDTARQKQEHRTRWYRKEAGVARHRTAKTRASHALVSKARSTECPERIRAQPHPRITFKHIHASHQTTSTLGAQKHTSETHTSETHTRSAER